MKKFKIIGQTAENAEIAIVTAERGEIINIGSEPFSVNSRCVLIVEGFNGPAKVAKIWQMLDCPDDEWGQDWCEPNAAASDYARQHNAPQVAMPEGITPLTREGWLALPDDNAPGTWFIVSEAWYLVKFPGLQPHYTGASDE